MEKVIDLTIISSVCKRLMKDFLRKTFRTFSPKEMIIKSSHYSKEQGFFVIEKAPSKCESLAIAWQKKLQPRSTPIVNEKSLIYVELNFNRNWLFYLTKLNHSIWFFATIFMIWQHYFSLSVTTDVYNNNNNISTDFMRNVLDEKVLCSFCNFYGYQWVVKLTYLKSFCSSFLILLFFIAFNGVRCGAVCGQCTRIIYRACFN